MWNSLHPIVLPAVLLHLVPENAKNTYLGLLTFMGLLLAMVIQPVSGALSDRWRSRWGKRRPLIFLGTVLDFIFLSILAWSGSLIWVFVGYIGLQITSNIAHGPLQGLLPDSIPSEMMGVASGVKNLMDIGGLIIASLAAGNLLSPQERYPTTIMLVVMAILALSSTVTLFFTKESPTNKMEIAEKQLDLKSVFKIDRKANSNYIWLIITRFIFLLGVYGVQAFAQYYIVDVLSVENPVKATGDLMAALALTLIIFAVIGGWLTDRFGVRRVQIIASVITTVGCLLLITANTIQALTIFGGIVGAGVGLFLTSNWALVNRMVPPDESGKFLGLTNLATAGAGALGRLEGPLIDLLNNISPGGTYLGYTALFVFGAFCALVSALFLSRVIKYSPMHESES